MGGRVSSDAQAVDLVVDAVALTTGQCRSDIFHGGRGTAAQAEARQLAMYLAHTQLGMSLTRVGELFCRDKTTVSHAVPKIENKRDSDPFDARLEQMENGLSGLLPDAYMLKQVSLRGKTRLGEMMNALQH